MSDSIGIGMRVLLVVCAAMVLSAQSRPVYTPPDIVEQRLVQQRPIYPELAKQARIEGTVTTAVLIDEDGEVERLRLISGHPFLVKAAFDAIKHWRYRPWGFPVMTTVAVTFRLGMDRDAPIPTGVAARNLPERLAHPVTTRRTDSHRITCLSPAQMNRF